jgi:hypothetical protein
MLELGEKAYEDLRYEFVESRRLNKEHPMWKKLWNGVSPNCFSDNSNPKQDFEAAREWYEYLLSKPNGERYISMYHPWLKEHFENVGLEEFFS